ncbi:cupin domain-containing protein [Aquimarina sp. 2201CG5-10]|uniref:cupin domain-containing protein n=1 Tax=Aquimarina callyspongiae TaxID=3098150 RepID=UPI002AB4BD4C|nr:cupin domain-containing protein [Aquimarina sp. 2201CG5-10]MDY8137207.1 cupin domain-containing protein [Aquimarina sp. 2201CG5-10]
MTRKIVFFCFITLIGFSCKKSKEVSNLPKENTEVPIHVSSDEGKKWNVFGVQITGKILSDQSNDEYSVIVTETPAKGGPPMHTHTHEDELFYILKGNFIFNCGDKKISAKKGDFIRLPRGIPHNFVNIDTVTGITMNTITPGGFENFFNDVAKVSKDKTLTKQKVDSLAHSYGVTFIKN